MPKGLDSLISSAKTRIRDRRLAALVQRARSRSKALAVVQQLVVQAQQQRQMPISKQQAAPAARSVERFYILCDKADEVRQYARSLGDLQVQIEPVEQADAQLSFPDYDDTAYPTHAAYQQAKKQWAASRASRYCLATVTATQPAERVVGVARKITGDDGKEHAVFYTLPGEADLWTAQRMRRIDFTRCDLCGVRHHRTRVFLVREPDGTIYQAGGTCADNLDLAKRVSNMKRAFKSMARWLSDNSEDLDFYEQGAPSTFDPATVLALADYLINAYGFVPADADDAYTGTLSTKSHLLMLMGKKGRADRAEIMRQIRSRGGKPSKMLAEAKKWAAREHKRIEKIPAFKRRRGDDLTFANNVAVALQTGSYRLLGTLAAVPHLMRKTATRQARQAVAHPWQPEVAPVAVGGAVSAVGKDEVYIDPHVHLRLKLEPGLGPRVVDEAGDPDLLASVRYVVERGVPSNVAATVALMRPLERTFVDDQGRTKPIHRPYLLECIAKAVQHAAFEAFGKLKTEPPHVSNAEALALFDAYPQSAALLGVSDAVLARMRKAPGKEAAKGLRSKLARHAPGVWTVIERRATTFEDYRSRSNRFVTRYFYDIMREADGATISWTTTDQSDASLLKQIPKWHKGGRRLDTGDKILIKAATVGQVFPPHAKYNAEKRKVTRLSWVLTR